MLKRQYPVPRGSCQRSRKEGQHHHLRDSHALAPVPRDDTKNCCCTRYCNSERTPAAENQIIDPKFRN